MVNEGLLFARLETIVRDPRPASRDCQVFSRESDDSQARPKELILQKARATDF